MSWYIDFRIGKFSQSWKYHFPSEISLLFTGDHQLVRPYIQQDNQNLEPGAFVGFRTTVSKAQKALNQLGLTRAFFESIYDAYRTDLASHCTSFLQGVRHGMRAVQKHTQSKEQNSPPFMQTMSQHGFNAFRGYPRKAGQRGVGQVR